MAKNGKKCFGFNFRCDVIQTTTNLGSSRPLFLKAFLRKASKYLKT